jgi:hypothetical protein
MENSATVSRSQGAKDITHKKPNALHGVAMLRTAATARNGIARKTPGRLTNEINRAPACRAPIKPK